MVSVYDIIFYRYKKAYVSTNFTLYWWILIWTEVINIIFNKVMKEIVHQVLNIIIMKMMNIIVFRLVFNTNIMRKINRLIINIMVIRLVLNVLNLIVRLILNILNIIIRLILNILNILVIRLILNTRKIFRLALKKIKRLHLLWIKNRLLKMLQ